MPGPHFARHFQYQWRWLTAAIAAACFAGVIASIPFRESAKILDLGLIFGVFCLLLVPTAIAQFTVMEFDEDQLIIVGPLRRRAFRLGRLTSVKYRSGKGNGAYVLAFADGRRLKLAVMGFDHDDRWKPLILANADRIGAPVAERARTSLSHASGSGRGWLA